MEHSNPRVYLKRTVSVYRYGDMERCVAKSDEYRAKAGLCRRMAAAAISPQDKATWLKLEAGWLALIHTRNQLGVERLEAMKHEPDT